MASYLNPELIISSLRLLLDSYKLIHDRFKDKRTPQRVEEVIITITQEQASHENIDIEHVERLLGSRLDPADAEIVKSDLQLLNFLVFSSPDPEMFDYWGMLTTLVVALQKFAVEHRIFELRGVQGSLGEVLKLEKTSKAILNKTHLRDFHVGGPRLSLHDVTATVALLQSTQDLPLRMILEATFDYYGGGGYGDTHKEYYDALYAIEQGPRPHWLRFRRVSNEFHLVENWQVMLTAPQVKGIVEALRDDIHAYAQELKSNENLIAPLFGQIKQFSKTIASS